MLLSYYCLLRYPCDFLNEILKSFIAGFEKPIGEGEVVLRLHDEFKVGTDA